MSRLLLQIGTALLALIPIATGIVTMLGAEAHWQCRLAQSGATP